MRKLWIVVSLVVLVLGMSAASWGAERSGGTCSISAPYDGDFFSLDPHVTTRTQDYLVTINLHRSLYKWDATQNKPAIDLPESVAVSADGLTYTYTLRNNIKFHNGRGMTVDDIIWSYERILNPATASPCARRLRVIQGAEDFETGKAASISGLNKIDDYALAVTFVGLLDPSYPLFEPCSAILPREEVEKDPDAFGLSPIGAGPFTFANWVKGSELVMEKFDGYYEAGKPYLDKVIFSVMPEAAPRDVAFRAKELDITIVESSQYEEYLKNPELSQNMVEVAEMYTRSMGFNRDFAPFADKRVRQAINYAINSALIVEKFLKNKAYPAVGYLPTTSSAFDPEATGYTYDEAKALALMKEAGYENGFEFTCIAASNKAWGAEVLETLIPFLKKINVTIKIEQLEGGTLAQRVMNEQNWDAYMWSLDSGPDPNQALARWSSKNSQSGGNFIRYNNPEFDQYLDQATQATDPAKQTEYLRKADAVFTEDAALWFFNYNKAVLAAQPWVHGMQPVAVELMYQNMADVWIDETSPRANEK